MILVSQNIYVTGNGDTWIWPITVTNNSAVSATSVEVVNTFNTGFTVDVATPSQGSYDMGLGIWTIGTMAPGADWHFPAITVLSARVPDYGQKSFSNDRG